MTNPDPFKNDWRRRRKMVFWVLIYCATLVAYCAVEGGDSQVRQSIGYGCLGLAGIVVLGYLGFPVADDKFTNMARAMMARQQDSAGYGYGAGTYGAAGWNGGEPPLPTPPGGP